MKSLAQSHWLQQQLDLSSPHIMGVLNITPDSFSDGNQFSVIDKAIARAMEMEAEGASIIDIGGESTRPGAIPVSAKQQIERVLPVIQALQGQSQCLISIDTSEPEVMQAAIEAGAHFINDVRGLSQAGAVETVAALQVPVCLAHWPEKMNHWMMPQQPLIESIKIFMREKIQHCEQAGIARNYIILDPGINFGKTYNQSFQILSQLAAFAELKLPLLLGLSRKLTRCIDKDYAKRIYGDLALAVYSLTQGVNIIRTHEVKATGDAIKMLNLIRENQA